MHVFNSPVPSLCLARTQIRYYGSTALAITFEDIVIGLGRKAGLERTTELSSKRAKTDGLASGNMEDTSSKSVASTAGPPAKVWRWVGYFWVMSFDMWATSKLVYASVQCG